MKAKKERARPKEKGDATGSKDDDNDDFLTNFLPTRLSIHKTYEIFVKEI